MNQIIVGAVQGDLVPIRYGFELFDRAKSDKKNIFVVEGASHYELYDKPEYVRQSPLRPSLCGLKIPPGFCSGVWNRQRLH